MLTLVTVTSSYRRRMLRQVTKSLVSQLKNGLTELELQVKRIDLFFDDDG